ncbi:MAG: methionyl aminopeptidase [Bradymonadia bacterium]|jgi:methionyl aminopeptidase
MLYRARPKGIQFKSNTELEAMRKAGRLAAECLQQLCEGAKQGTSTLEIDEMVQAFCAKHNATAATLNYKGYPKSCCTSINEVICHGIPARAEVLKSGDIVGIDVTLIVDGFFGDNCATVLVGDVSDSARKLVKTTLEATRAGIYAVKPGARLSAVGNAIQAVADAAKFSVVRDFVGHGIGRAFHEEPQVHHHGNSGANVKLRPGMTFTIEPMINEGVYDTVVLEDDWTAVTADRKLSAQFEHTIAVTQDGVELLTVQNGTGDWEVPGLVQL